MVAAPGDPGNGLPLSALGKSVKVDIAYGGSCTAGKRPGRSGPGQVWLASPPTVMASALAGELLSFEALQSRVAVKSELLLNK